MKDSFELDLDDARWNPESWDSQKGYTVKHSGGRITIEVRGTKELVEALNHDSFVINVTTTNIDESTKNVDIRVEFVDELKGEELAIIESPESLSVTVTKTERNAA